MRNVRPAGWWFDGLLLAGFVALTIALAARSPLLHLDLAVRDFVNGHRPGWAYWAARVLNYAGQGGIVLTPLAGLTALWLIWRRHSVRPALPVIAAFVVTDLTIGPLKLWTDRLAASSSAPHPEYLFHAPDGVSYPSGHVVNAIVWYGTLAVLLGRTLEPVALRVLRYGAPALVVLTTTYTSFHWITDGLGAVLIGLFLDRLLQRVPWDRIPLGRRLEATGWAGAAGLDDVDG